MSFLPFILSSLTFLKRMTAAADPRSWLKNPPFCVVNSYIIIYNQSLSVKRKTTFLRAFPGFEDPGRNTIFSKIIFFFTISWFRKVIHIYTIYFIHYPHIVYSLWITCCFPVFFPDIWHIYGNYSCSHPDCTYVFLLLTADFFHRLFTILSTNNRGIP